MIDPRSEPGDYFLADVDNLVGGSGAGVFDQDARLLGLASEGEPDFEETNAGCMRARTIAEDQRFDQGEKIGYVAPMMRALPGPNPRAAHCAASEPGASARTHRDSGLAALAFCVLLDAVRRLRRRR